MADTVTELLEGKIKKASDESGSFENINIKDAIEAEKYEQSKALSNPFSGCAKAIAIAAGPVQ